LKKYIYEHNLTCTAAIFAEPITAALQWYCNRSRLTSSRDGKILTNGEDAP